MPTKTPGSRLKQFAHNYLNKADPVLATFGAAVLSTYAAIEFEASALMSSPQAHNIALKAALLTSVGVAIVAAPVVNALAKELSRPQASDLLSLGLSRS